MPQTHQHAVGVFREDASLQPRTPFGHVAHNSCISRSDMPGPRTSERLTKPMRCGWLLAAFLRRRIGENRNLYTTIQLTASFGVICSDGFHLTAS